MLVGNCQNLEVFSNVIGFLDDGIARVTTIEMHKVPMCILTPEPQAGDHGFCTEACCRDVSCKSVTLCQCLISQEFYQSIRMRTLHLVVIVKLCMSINGDVSCGEISGLPVGL